MQSWLYTVGLLFGIGLGVIAVASVVMGAVAAVAWLNAFVVILARRIDQSQPQDQAAKREQRTRSRPPASRPRRPAAHPRQRPVVIGHRPPSRGLVVTRANKTGGSLRSF
jgi:hypothetical protein